MQGSGSVETYVCLVEAEVKNYGFSITIKKNDPTEAEPLSFESVRAGFDYILSPLTVRSRASCSFVNIPT